MTIETALAVYDQLVPDWRAHARQRGDERTISCPFPGHDDMHPSFDINVRKGTWTCRAGCGGGGAAELARRLRGEDGARALLRDLGGEDQPHPPRGHITARYPYKGADGQVLYEVVRLEPKDFRVRRPDGKGSWIWGLGDVPRVLYWLRELLAADPAIPVFVVEGEKDADALATLGLVATTNVGGAGKGKWKGEYTTLLAGRDVVILPDNDAAGRTHGQSVARALYGQAARVRVVELPGLPDKGDVSDWLAAGGTRAELERLVAATPTWAPHDDSDSVNHKTPHRDRIELWTPRSLPEIAQATPPDVPWIWEGYIAAGYLTLLVGLYKAGKTTLVTSLLKALNGIMPTFAGRPVRGCKVLVVSEEGDGMWGRRERDFQIGGHVHVVTRPFRTVPTTSEWQELVDHLVGLVTTEGFNLVVIDPLAGQWPVVDENDAGQVSRAIVPLRALLDAGAAVLLLHHARKSDGTEGTASRGSGALPGAVNVIVELRRLDGDVNSTQRVLTGLSHLDETPRELVIDYCPETGGFVSVGTRRADVRREGRWQVVRTLLRDANHPLRVEDIVAKWPPDTIPTPGETALKADCTSWHGAGFIGRSGAGKKGDPYRYTLADDAMEESDSIRSRSHPYRGDGDRIDGEGDGTDAWQA